MDLSQLARGDTFEAEVDGRVRILTFRMAINDRLVCMESESVMVIRQCGACGQYTTGHQEGLCLDCYTQKYGERDRKRDVYRRAERNRRHMEQALVPRRRVTGNDSQGNVVEGFMEAKHAARHDIKQEGILDLDVCALTGTKLDRRAFSVAFGRRDEAAMRALQIDKDHFVALSTGHIGSVIGNVVPILHSLNNLKGIQNPFEWRERTEAGQSIAQDRWTWLTEYLSGHFGLTPAEYREFVYWCYDHPRTIEQVIADGDIRSVDLWRDARRATEQV